MVATVPAAVGVDAAWIGEPGGDDSVVLAHSVNAAAVLVDGLVVPVGTGLGGKVMAQRRPLWVSDYCASPDISPRSAPAS